jgi:hypothetical protein
MWVPFNNLNQIYSNEITGRIVLIKSTDWLNAKLDLPVTVT